MLVYHVLVVCTANQCRSPMAEALLRARAARRPGPHAVEVRSAGTWAAADQPATDHAVAVMSERGHDIHAHRSREIDAESVAWADLVLVMTDNHRQAIEGDFPGVRGRVRLMSSLGGGSWDVADPVGGSLDDYRATADELERLLDAGWPQILEAAAGGPGLSGLSGLSG